MLPAPRTVHRQTFTSQFVGQEECGCHVFRRRACREIDRFGDSAVAMALEDGLHPHMMGRVNIMCRDEESPHILGNPRQVLDRLAMADLPTQRGQRETPCPGLSEKFRMEREQLNVFHNGTCHADPVQRFDSSGTVCDDADGSRRRNGRDGGIAASLPLCLQTAASIGRKDSPLCSQLARR